MQTVNNHIFNDFCAKRGKGLNKVQFDQLKQAYLDLERAEFIRQNAMDIELRARKILFENSKLGKAAAKIKNIFSRGMAWM